MWNCRRWFCPPDFRLDPGWLKEDEFRKTYKPTGEGAIDEKYEYARWRFDAADRNFDELNARAHRLFQFAAALAGALLAALKLGDTEPARWALATPSLILFCVSAAQALIAHLTGIVPFAPTIRGAMATDGATAEWKEQMVVSLHCVVRGLHVFTDWQADRINASTYAMIGGIASLALLLFA
ncbi:MAG: hypothetical protein AB7G12_12555 [Thermoanaerobaculia bacterium]